MLISPPKPGAIFPRPDGGYRWVPFNLPVDIDPEDCDLTVREWLRLEERPSETVRDT